MPLRDNTLQFRSFVHFNNHVVTVSFGEESEIFHYMHGKESSQNTYQDSFPKRLENLQGIDLT